jgi:hypothetical protein
MKAEELKKELKAKVEKIISYRATSKDGKTVANGHTELEALKLLQKTLSNGDHQTKKGN